MQAGAERYDYAVHAYVLMTNYAHLRATPNETDSVSRALQYVGRRDVPYINHSYGTSGTLWEGRYKASVVDDEPYLLTCMRYIELKRIGVRLKLTHYGTIAGEIKSLSKDAVPIENVGLVYAARVAMAQSNIRHCKTNLYRF